MPRTVWIHDGLSRCGGSFWRMLHDVSHELPLA